MNFASFARRAANTLCSRHATRCLQARYVATTPTTHHKEREPLNILFCGSDDFSIASLQTLVDLKEKSNSPIRTIDVLCRPDKRVGAGLKTVNEVPIKRAARNWNLPIHQIDNFDQYRPDQLTANINLIIAVSFGLLIPAQVIAAATYGGLNVHPSLLPDLRGAAPIHYALLHQRSHTGVTVQTLHPTKFDHGQIVAQTAWPGIVIPAAATPARLLPILAAEGATLLKKVIETGAFVDLKLRPAPSKHEILAMTNGKGTAVAPRLKKSDMRIDWSTMSAETILLRHRVFGRLWDDSSYQKLFTTRVPVRIAFDELREVRPDWAEVMMMLEPGGPSPGKLWFIDSDGEKPLYICAADRSVVEIVRCTIANKKAGQGKAEILRFFKEEHKAEALEFEKALASIKAS